MPSWGQWGAGGHGQAGFPISLSHCCLPRPYSTAHSPRQILVSRHFCFLLSYPDAGTTRPGGNMVWVTRTIVLLIPSLTTWFLDHRPWRDWRNQVGAGLVCVLDPDPTHLPHMQGALERAGGPQGTLRGQLGAHTSTAPGGCFHLPGGPERPIVPRDVQPVCDWKAGLESVQLEHLPLKGF